MPGFQPVYSGNTLTQAARGAAQYIAAAGEIRGQMYRETAGTIAGLVGGGIKAYQERPTDEQVQQAKDEGALPQDASNVSAAQYRAGLTNQQSLLQAQTAAIQLKNARAAANIAVGGRSTLLGPVAGGSPNPSGISAAPYGVSFTPSFGNYGGGK